MFVTGEEIKFAPDSFVTAKFIERSIQQLVGDGLHDPLMPYTLVIGSASCKVLRDDPQAGFPSSPVNVICDQFPARWQWTRERLLLDWVPPYSSDLALWNRAPIESALAVGSSGAYVEMIFRRVEWSVEVDLARIAADITDSFHIPPSLYEKQHTPTN